MPASILTQWMNAIHKIHTAALSCNPIAKVLTKYYTIEYINTGGEDYGYKQREERPGMGSIGQRDI